MGFLIPKAHRNLGESHSNLAPLPGPLCCSFFEVNVQETNIRIARKCTMKFRWCISYTIFPTTWRLWTSYSFRLTESHQNHKNLLTLRENKFLCESGAQGYIPRSVSWEVLATFVLKTHWVRIDWIWEGTRLVNNYCPQQVGAQRSNACCSLGFLSLLHLTTSLENSGPLCLRWRKTHGETINGNWAISCDVQDPSYQMTTNMFVNMGHLPPPIIFGVKRHAWKHHLE